MVERLPGISMWQRGVLLAMIVLLHAALLLWFARTPNPQIVPVPTLPPLTITLLAPLPPIASISVPPRKAVPSVTQKISRAPTQLTPRQAPVVADAALQQAVSAPPAAPAPEVAAAEPLATPRFDAAYLNNQAPVYPPLSRRLGESGRVMLKVFVASNGKPNQVEIQRSSGYARLDSAAQRAVWSWTFVPARRGQEAEGAWVSVPVQFDLTS